jgi:hypothetical protein
VYHRVDRTTNINNNNNENNSAAATATFVIPVL